MLVSPLNNFPVVTQLFETSYFHMVTISVNGVNVESRMLASPLNSILIVQASDLLLTT